MGHIYVEALIEGSRSQEQETVGMFVDTGSTFSSLPEAVADRLGLVMRPGRQPVEVAGGRIQSYPVGVADLKIMGRVSIGEKFLIGLFPEPVLGVLALEALGLAVDPATGEVRPSRGWQARLGLQARPVGSRHTAEEGEK